MAEAKKTAFEILNAINVNEHTETKDTGGVKLTYLSWAWAWAEVKKKFPDANYEIIKFNGLPYVYDQLTGFIVYTTVTINGITHEMWLPVMDGNNKAMKAEPYQVQTKYKTITVNAATMFDINKTIMRCLTKNLAMFGLGLYIYAGEDIPETDPETIQQQPKKQQEQPKTQQQPTRSETRQKLKDFCIKYQIDQTDVVKACNLNKNSTDEDYEKAYNYAMDLLRKRVADLKTKEPEEEVAGQLPFEV